MEYEPREKTVTHRDILYIFGHHSKALAESLEECAKASRLLPRDKLHLKAIVQVARLSADIQVSLINSLTSWVASLCKRDAEVDKALSDLDARLAELERGS